MYASAPFYKAGPSVSASNATAMNKIVEKFNSLRDSTTAATPFKARFELIAGYSYDIKELQIMDTKYGECLVVEVYEPTHFSNDSTSDTFKVFLPKRFKLAFTSPSEIETLNKERNLKIRFGNLHDRSTFYCQIVTSGGDGDDGRNN